MQSWRRERGRERGMCGGACEEKKVGSRKRRGGKKRSRGVGHMSTSFTFLDDTCSAV